MQRDHAAVVKGTQMRSGLCECISWMANVIIFINITFRNLAQTCASYLVVHYSFGVQNNNYNPILTLITKTNCQYVFFVCLFVLRLKNLVLRSASGFH